MLSLYLVLILLLSKGHTQIPDVLTSEGMDAASPVVLNNEATQSGDTSPSKVVETATDILTTIGPNNEGSNSTSNTLNIANLQNNNTALYTYHGDKITPKDRVAMRIVSTVSNFVVAGVIFFKLTKCAIPHWADAFTIAARPTVTTVLLMPMQVAGTMLEFVLGPIISFLILVLTPVTLFMRLTLTPVFGRIGHSVNYFLEPVISFIGIYLDHLLYPLKIVSELIENYWIKPVFGPLFAMIEVILDPLSKLLAKLLNRLAPVIELIEPLLEPLLSVSSSLAPTLRMLPGASMILKVVILLLGHGKVEVSFLTKLLATFDPDKNPYQ